MQDTYTDEDSTCVLQRTQATKMTAPPVAMVDSPKKTHENVRESGMEVMEPPKFHDQRHRKKALELGGGITPGTPREF